MYNFFSPTEIKPSGWLRLQLEIQLDGLGGNLDKVWPDVRDSAWVGGDIPFGQNMPRITIKANLARVNWDMADGYEYASAAAPRTRNAVGDKEIKTLIPYGCAKLRMTEMPMVIKK